MSNLDKEALNARGIQNALSFLSKLDEKVPFQPTVTQDPDDDNLIGVSEVNKEAMLNISKDVLMEAEAHLSATTDLVMAKETKAVNKGGSEVAVSDSAKAAVCKDFILTIMEEFMPELLTFKRSPLQQCLWIY